MRTRATVIIALLALAAPQFGSQALPQSAPPATPATTGVVRGVVTQLGSGAPIAEAKVTVGPSGAGSTIQALVNSAAVAGVSQAVLDAAIARGVGQQNGVAAPLETVTDNSGRFVIAGVPLGPHGLTVQRDGFFGLPDSSGFYSPVATTNILVATQPVEVAVSLIPGSTVTGTVRDSAGRPMADAQVAISRLTYQNGHPVLQQAASRPTDDRGQFRLFRAPPGEYYLSATPSPSVRNARGGVAAGPRELPLKTYYPSAIDPAEATPLLLRGGDELSGMQIGVRAATAVKIRGRITSPIPVFAVPVAGAPPTAAGARFYLAPRDRAMAENTAAGFTSRVTPVSPVEAQFEIDNVTPGDYTLYAIVQNAVAPTAPGVAGDVTVLALIGNQGNLVARAPVSVAGLDIDGLNLVAQKGVELTGRVTLEGAPTTGNVQVALTSEDSGPGRALPAALLAGNRGAARGQGPGAQVFTLNALPETGYAVQITLGPAARGLANGPLAGVYVDDVQFEGKSVYDSGFLVGVDSPGLLEVLLKKGSGVIEGTVSGPDGKPAAGATVAILPPPARRQNMNLYSSITADGSGRFALRGIAPGDYRLFAWDRIPPGAFQNAAFIARDEERGRPITVNPNDHLETQLNLIQKRTD